MGKPVLNRMQRAWLQEIGIDAKMLAHYSAAPFSGTESRPPAAGAATVPDIAVPDAAAAPPSVHGRTGPPSGGLAHIAGLLKQAASAGEAPSAESAPAAAPLPEGVTLVSLREHVARCQACGLHEVRSRTVFGEGVESSPRWMFIGEAPGEFDDSAGRPFQGRAGELLAAMLASVGIAQGDAAYFTNVLKCRPMGNRSPQAQEVAACLPWLRRQISLLRPASLVALGRVSAAALLGLNEELEALRGRVHAYIDEDGRSIPLVVTHHPASLLLHGQQKADAWRDLNLLRNLGA